MATLISVENTTSDHPAKELAEKSSEFQGKATTSKSKSSSKTRKNSQSRKSASSSTSHKFRRKRTLKRKPSFHEFTDADRKYIWAAYKLGAFGDIGTQQEFDARLALYLSMNDKLYIFEAPTPRGRIPVGLVAGKFMGPVIWLVDAVWFPWASDRNKYESMVNLFQETRKHYVALFTCTIQDLKFYEKVAKHGVIRRVGTLHDIADDKLAQWQTRKL